MKKALIAVVIVLGLALAGTIYYCISLSQDKNALTSELKLVQSALVSTQAELATTNKTLASTLTELGATRDTLTSTRSELGTTRDTLISTRSELSNTNQTLTSKLTELSSANDKITSAQKSLTALQDSISSTQKQLTAAQETLKGLGITVSASLECWDVQLVDNSAAKNPTWNDLMSFIAKDKTENHTYILNTYDCSQFSRDVHNNAEAAGIRAAEVQIFFENEKMGHALNAFLTTDYGLVYIDCTETPDKIARVKTGKEYRAINLSWANGVNARNDSWFESQPIYYYMKTSTGSHAITSKFRIYW
jgi:myosin heavy subunit